jgi:hypothetical protein
MKNNIQSSVYNLTVSALLISIGIAIPMFMPIKLILEPASFTLASHVAIFIAIMISPSIAIAVTIGTTIGFAISGFPPAIILRAASHIVFASAGSYYFKNNHNILNNKIKLRIFSLVIALIHAACELAVVTAFYFGGNLNNAYYEQGFIHSVLLLVGLGTIIHSIVDFELALLIYKALNKQHTFISFR